MLFGNRLQRASSVFSNARRQLARRRAFSREYLVGVARRWQRFRERYHAELARRPDGLRVLNDLRRRGRVTLVFAARDEARNHAVVLRDTLDERPLP